MKIRIKELVEGCFPVRTGNNKSDCYDLFLGEDVTIKKGEIYVAKLGIAAQLPKGMIARVYSRSSLPVKLSLSIPNGIGFIDNSYNGEEDEWKAPLYAYKNLTLPRGTRICQFEIAPSTFATRWQKIKWLLSSGVSLVKVDNLHNESRGGIGSTGV